MHAFSAVWLKEWMLVNIVLFPIAQEHVVTFGTFGYICCNRCHLFCIWEDILDIINLGALLWAFPCSHQSGCCVYLWCIFFPFWFDPKGVVFLHLCSAQYSGAMEAFDELFAWVPAGATAWTKPSTFPHLPSLLEAPPKGLKAQRGFPRYPLPQPAGRGLWSSVWS